MIEANGDGLVNVISRLLARAKSPCAKSNTRNRGAYTNRANSIVIHGFSHTILAQRIIWYIPSFNLITSQGIMMTLLLRPQGLVQVVVVVGGRQGAPHASAGIARPADPWPQTWIVYLAVRKCPYGAICGETEFPTQERK